jgi:hypothetical protein
VNRLRAARKARHHLNRSGTISQTVEYLHAALALASNHDLGMAIAELDLPDWPASSVKLAEDYSSPDSSRSAALCRDTDTRIARSEPPSARDRSRVRASFKATVDPEENR